MAFTAGLKIDAYEILSLLGTGGMGEVYRARDSALKRDVAIKVLPPGQSGNSERQRRFMQEAQAAIRCLPKSASASRPAAAASS